MVPAPQTRAGHSHFVTPRGVCSVPSGDIARVHGPLGSPHNAGCSVPGRLVTSPPSLGSEAWPRLDAVKGDFLLGVRIVGAR